MLFLMSCIFCFFSLQQNNRRLSVPSQPIPIQPYLKEPNWPTITAALMGEGGAMVLSLTCLGRGTGGRGLILVEGRTF